MVALENCPFCGGPAMITTVDKNIKGKTNFPIEAHVRCNHCPSGNFYMEKEAAITAWNTRHNTTEVSELQAERDMLRELVRIKDKVINQLRIARSRQTYFRLFY